MAATADLRDYRETCLPPAVLGSFSRDALAAIDTALAWRAQASEHCRFWPEAEGFSLVTERDGAVIGGQWVPGDDEAWAKTCDEDLAVAWDCCVTILNDGIDLGKVT